eukprot:6476977-Pyramimonas_sp.AAC.1
MPPCVLQLRLGPAPANGCEGCHLRVSASCHSFLRVARRRFLHRPTHPIARWAHYPPCTPPSLCGQSSNSQTPFRFTQRVLRLQFLDLRGVHFTFTHVPAAMTCVRTSPRSASSSLSARLAAAAAGKRLAAAATVWRSSVASTPSVGSKERSHWAFRKVHSAASGR